MYTPSAPPNGCTRAQALWKARNNVKATKTPPPTRPAIRPTPNAAVPVRAKPPTRRVTFSKWKHTQEYNPRDPPEHTRSSGLRAGFGST
ncbi:hypothetical protein FRC03_004408 [Tulasnella sp. 419]|nr:hypothetical protein FRC03_004408 [Tulasnella sp. 419]